jgi:hypothetical protein
VSRKTRLADNKQDQSRNLRFRPSIQDYKLCVCQYPNNGIFSEYPMKKGDMALNDLFDQHTQHGKTMAHNVLGEATHTQNSSLAGGLLRNIRSIQM